MIKTKKNYELLLCDLEKHSELIEADLDLDCLGRIKNKIFKADLIENYGWKIPDPVEANDNWFNINSEISAGTFGGEGNASIAWEDDGKEPAGEFLLTVSFSTGAYFFGRDYDTAFFNRFFNELAGFGPSFKDSANKALYFSKDKAGELLTNYDGIVTKYREQYRADSNKRKADKLRLELAKLEAKP